MSLSEERLKSNLKILEILQQLAYNNPDLRFWQLLAAFRIIEYEQEGTELPKVVDKFYEESSTTLKKLTTLIKNKC